MDSMKPSIVERTPQKEQPPPYTAATGMENKALEHSMDMGLGLDDPKNMMYSAQGTYSFHVPRTGSAHPGQNTSHNDCKLTR